MRRQNFRVWPPSVTHLSREHHSTLLDLSHMPKLAVLDVRASRVRENVKSYVKSYVKLIFHMHRICSISWQYLRQNPGTYEHPGFAVPTGVNP